jgi:tRNA (guanine37-N1)-methyltransferase
MSVTQRMVLALCIPKRMCQEFLSQFRKHPNSLLNMPRMGCLVAENEHKDTGNKLLLLNENFKELGDLPTDLKKLVADNGATALQYALQLPENSYFQELRALLPEGVGVPTGYERVGHVAHFNLRDEHLPHKTVIGETLMAKVVGIRTVVNKTDEISNEFRVFPMEIIAGEDDLVTTVKENGASFTLDFGKVYWNSRLGTEHQRLADAVPAGAVVWDMMAGIGPFAVPLARKRCVVHANDLNPDSYKYLQVNIVKNKLRSDVVQAYNMDARAWIKLLSERASQPNPVVQWPNHIVMNLPKTAVEFLDCLVPLADQMGALADRKTRETRIHCYCFEDPEIAMEAITQRVGRAVGREVQGITLHDVRNVSPTKHMYCVSIPLSAIESEDQDAQHTTKRQKTSEE